MKIYISGAITSDPNYREKFQLAEQYLSSQGHVPISPTIVPEGLTRQEYLNIDFAFIGICDAIYMLHGWQESRGSREEYWHALRLKKIIMYEPQDGFEEKTKDEGLTCHPELCKHFKKSINLYELKCLNCSRYHSDKFEKRED
jgi:hypothetical protein